MEGRLEQDLNGIVTLVRDANSSQADRDESVGAKVNRFQALTTFINQQKAERDKLEMELKADGIRLPGMTRARKVKAATRTRKAKGDATASAE